MFGTPEVGHSKVAEACGMRAPYVYVYTCMRGCARVCSLQPAASRKFRFHTTSSRQHAHSHAVWVPCRTPFLAHYPAMLYA